MLKPKDRLTLRTPEDSYLKWEKLIGNYGKKQKKKMNREIGWLLVIIALLIIAAAMLLGERLNAAPPTIAFEWTQSREVYEIKLHSFLDDWFDSVSPKKLKRAKTVVPTLLDVCEKRGVNPALVGAIVSLESSWYSDAVGSLGERGLMQVNPSVRRVGDDHAEQLDVGVLILQEGYARCGSVLGAISWYGTGRTCKPYRGAEKRMKLAARIEGYDGRPDTD